MAVDHESFALFLESLRRFVDERVIPREKEIDGLDQPPADFLADIRDMGLLGLTYPEEYGGLALNAVQEVEVGLVLGRTTPAMRNFISIHNGVAGQCIVRGATDEQKRHYLPRLASGEIIGAFALTEPDVGSDARNIGTRATRDGNEWIINGTKRFISNAPFAGLITVLARTEAAGEKPAISGFLVDAGTPGMAIGKPEKKMGQHGAPICDVIFDECRVPHAKLLGEAPGSGFAAAMAGLDRGRLFIAACCVGLAYRVLELAVDYAIGRRQFGKPIAEHQLIQALLADSMTEAYAAEGMVRRAAAMADAGGKITMEASMCKYYATEMLGRVADRAVQVHGGNGYIEDYMVEQIYRDVRVLRIYEGTSQIQQLIIARNLIQQRTEGRTFG